MAKQSKTSAQRLIGAEKRLRALELRKCGATFAEIGKSLEISTQRAHKIVMEELERLALLRLGNADELRRLELERLEMASIPVVSKVKQGDLQAAMVWIKLSESRRKLLGIDAPARQEISGPEGGPIEVNDAREALRAKLLG
jgi:hypothetical protein